MSSLTGGKRRCRGLVGCELPASRAREYNTSKRRLREFYHEKFSPASDVDLFLYGLTEEEAIEKIKQIEAHIRDVLLTEVVSVRTKHAITICKLSPGSSSSMLITDNNIMQAANIRPVTFR